MKAILRSILGVMLITLPNLFNCGSNSRADPISSLSTLCKVWGVLKYYHPKIKDGSVDWDSVGLIYIKKLNRDISFSELNSTITELIASRGPIESSDLDKDYSLMDALKWIEGSKLNQENKRILWRLISNYKAGYNHYAVQNNADVTVSFENEEAYKSMLYPNKDYRVLALFRAWNAINYFCPHKREIEVPMSTLLENFIPRMIQANDTIGYHSTLKRFSSLLNDSHAALSLSKVLLEPYTFRTSARVRYLQDSFVVSETDENNILKKGDVLLEVDNTPVEQLADSLKDYWNSSNVNTFKSSLSYFLLSGSDNQIELKIRRADSILNVDLSRKRQVNRVNENLDNIKRFREQDVLYIRNTPEGDIDYLDSILKRSKDVKGLIIDLRGSSPYIHYPTFVKHLFKKVKPWSKVYCPDPELPGNFILKEAGLKLELLADTELFSNRIIILVDEFTQSYLEYFAMFLQGYKSCITIGSQTAGADGNTARIYLPGNFKLVFTSCEVLYPDNTPTQRTGIHLDYNFSNTIESVRLGQDLVLNKALELLSIQ